ARARNRSPSAASRRSPMATQPTTQLLTTPTPVVTRYNRLVLYAACGAVALFVCTYVLVVREHGRRTEAARPVRLISSPQPLVTETPKAKPDLPPQPEPPVQPVVSMPPPQHESPAFPRQEDPLVKLRADERIKAFRGPILVKFDGTQPPPARRASPARPPRVLEVPPASTPPFPAPPFGSQQPSPFGGLLQPGLPTWATRDSTGRNADFWGLSGFARTPQIASAQLLPPRSPYQLNAGMQIPVVLGQDVTSDTESLF